jgi:hypothetical protein
MTKTTKKKKEDRSEVCRFHVLTFIAISRIPPTRNEIIQYVTQFDFKPEQVENALDELDNMGIFHKYVD